MVDNQDRNSNGSFRSEITYRDVIGAFDDCADPVVTAREIADVLSISRRTAHRHLTILESKGIVERKNVGSRATVWWLTDDSALTSAKEATARVRSEFPETLESRIGVDLPW